MEAQVTLKYCNIVANSEGIYYTAAENNSYPQNPQVYDRNNEKWSISALGYNGEFFYQTITLDSDQYVTEEFYNWFIEYAAKQ